MARVTILAFGVTILTLIAGPLHAQDDEAKEARALVEKAVKAQGGLEALTREVAIVRKSKGKFHSDDFEFSGESYSDLKDKRKIVLRGLEGNVQSTRTLVMEGEGKGWISFDGISQELDGKFLERMQTSIYCDRVAGLATILKDKGYTLQTLGESKFKDKAVLGIKVSKQGKPNVELFFDKISGFLVKSTNRTLDFTTEKETFQEVHHEDYRLVDAGASAEQVLKAAKLDVDAKNVVALLKKHTPTAKEREQIADQITKLGDVGFAVRQKASAALVQWGGKAAVLLRKALEDTDREIVRRAEKALEAIEQSPEPALLDAVLTLLELRRPEGAAEALLDYLPWAMNEQLAKEATSALAAVAEKDGKPNPAVLKALTDDDAVRKSAAAAVLGKDGGVWRQQGWRRVLLGGLTLAHKSVLWRDGKRTMDLETVEMRFYNRLDDTVFTRP